MKLNEIAKTVENINKINSMLNNGNFMSISLCVNDYNFTAYTQKELKTKLKECFNVEVVYHLFFIQEYEQRETNFLFKTSYIDYALSYKVEIHFYEER